MSEPIKKPVRICHERIIPHDQDPEVHVRRTMTAMSLEKLGDLNPDEIMHHKRMALSNSKKWPNASTLRCRFLDGSPKMRKAVEKAAHVWEKYANIKFQFVASGDAEIRISFFADDGSWSAVGRDALNRTYFPLHQPTMNFGWLRDNSSATEVASVVLHEFGHALGCIHEHQSPKFNRKWNVAKVLQYFQGSPNFWAPEDIRHNVLQKYSPAGVSATAFDPKSIMLYMFDAELFTDKKGPTNENNTLSATDREMIARMYPKS